MWPLWGPMQGNCKTFFFLLLGAGPNPNHCLSSFFFLKKVYIYKKKKPLPDHNAWYPSSGEVKEKNICFLATRLLQMFHRCLMCLMAQSRPFTSTEHLQQRFIYANRNWSRWDLNARSSPQFMETCPKFPASSQEDVPAERTAPADGPHQVPPQPLLSGNNRKLRLHLAQTHQTRSATDQKNVVWSDESPRLRHQAGVGVLRMWP